MNVRVCFPLIMNHKKLINLIIPKANDARESLLDWVRSKLSNTDIYGQFIEENDENLDANRSNYDQFSSTNSEQPQTPSTSSISDSDHSITVNGSATTPTVLQIYDFYKCWMDG